MRLWPFHQHRYFEVDREGAQMDWQNPRTGEVFHIAASIMEITERCADNRCGKYRQQKLVGHLPGGHQARGLMPEGAVVSDE